MDVLVGEWSWNGRAMNGSFEVTGWARYEWLEGRHFLIERAVLTARRSTKQVGIRRSRPATSWRLRDLLCPAAS
jgi:hypothetical protein